MLLPAACVLLPACYCPLANTFLLNPPANSPACPDNNDLLLTHTGHLLLPVQVWDRRCVSSARCVPQGVLLGHTEGITHLDSKGDGM